LPDRAACFFILLWSSRFRYTFFKRGVHEASLLSNASSALLIPFAGTSPCVMFYPPSSRVVVDTVTVAMRNVHFDVMGMSRTIWDFYFGFGLLLTLYLLFAAALSWHLGSLHTASSARTLAWAFVVC
jgi:hypothetical protein